MSFNLYSSIKKAQGGFEQRNDMMEVFDVSVFIPQLFSQSVLHGRGSLAPELLFDF